MKAKGFIALCLAAAAILAGLAWHGRCAAVKEEEALGNLSKKEAALDAKIRASKAEAAASAEDKAKLAAALASMRSGASVKGSSSPSGASAGEPGAQSPRSLASLLVSDPKLFDLYLASYRANLAVRFGAEFLKLGLTQAQIDKFEDAMTSHEADDMELRAAAESQGLSMSDPGVAAMRKDQNQQLLQAVSAATGASSSQIAQYQQNQNRTGQLQGSVNQVDFYAAADSAPLTYQQATQLKQIMAAASPSYQSGGAAQLQTVNWDAVAAQAGAFLNAQQVQAVQTTAQIQSLSNLVKQYYSQQGK